MITDSNRLLRRFLILRGSRWLPTGLLIPVLVLYLVDRGLSLTEVGLAAAAQGLIVVSLELPTGGLADAIGRRRVLLMANLFELSSLVIFLLSRSLTWFAVAFAVQGIYRALESGPLDAWFVDEGHRIGPAADIDRALGLGGVVLGLAIGLGAVLSGALVAFGRMFGVDPLAIPFIAAVVLRLMDTALVARLMDETDSAIRWDVVSTSLRAVPSIMAGALTLVRTSTVLGWIISVEVFWGFGMVAFESLFPPRLAERMGSADGAAALMGPVVAGAWVASALGAGAISWFSGKFGRHTTAAAMRIVQGAMVAMLGVLSGTVGLITAYLGCFLVHGAANPVHQALLHEEARSTNRATVISLNSLMGSIAAALGGIALGATADRAGIPWGMYVGGAVMAAAAPLYLVAARRRPAPFAAV